MNENGARESHIDWDTLVSRFIHSTKIAIIEAMRHIGRPLSASELEKVFGGGLVSSTLSYHLRSLAAKGVIEELPREKGKAGPEKTPFILASDVLQASTSR